MGHVQLFTSWLNVYVDTVQLFSGFGDFIVMSMYYAAVFQVADQLPFRAVLRVPSSRKCVSQLLVKQGKEGTTFISYSTLIAHNVYLYNLTAALKSKTHKSIGAEKNNMSRLFILFSFTDFNSDNQHNHIHTNVHCHICYCSLHGLVLVILFFLVAKLYSCCCPFS